MRGRGGWNSANIKNLRRKRIQAIVTGIAGALTFLTVSFTASFYLTAWLFEWLGFVPPLLIRQIVNSLIGLVLIIMVAGTIGYLTRGRQRHLQMGLFGPIVDALGKIAQGDYSVRLADDIHEFRPNEPVGILVKSVNSLAQELNQMEEMRQEFISNVSHEIQSPLTSIRGFARALNDEKLSPAERAHYLNIIETESMRLSKLTENLLALAALDSENHTLESKPYRVDSQVRDVVLACEPQWKDKQIEMDIETEPVTIAADRDLLGQVWVNLIHNSIKFTPGGGKICIQLHPKDRSAEFHISDTGIGISPGDREHVFERFFKGDRARERSKGGSGLGLAIAKKIVEMHHGTIAVESQVGAGTTFHVTLPLN